GLSVAVDNAHPTDGREGRDYRPAYAAGIARTSGRGGVALPGQAEVGMGDGAAGALAAPRRVRGVVSRLVVDVSRRGPSRPVAAEPGSGAGAGGVGRVALLRRRAGRGDGAGADGVSGGAVRDEHRQPDAGGGRYRRACRSGGTDGGAVA